MTDWLNLYTDSPYILYSTSSCTCTHMLKSEDVTSIFVYSFWFTDAVSKLPHYRLQIHKIFNHVNLASPTFNVNFQYRYRLGIIGNCPVFSRLCPFYYMFIDFFAWIVWVVDIQSCYSSYSIIKNTSWWLKWLEYAFVWCMYIKNLIVFFVVVFKISSVC